jgi:hypothetical protein
MSEEEGLTDKRLETILRHVDDLIVVAKQFTFYERDAPRAEPPSHALSEPRDPICEPSRAGQVTRLD